MFMQTRVYAVIPIVVCGSSIKTRGVSFLSAHSFVSGNDHRSLKGFGVLWTQVFRVFQPQRIGALGHPSCLRKRILPDCHGKPCVTMLRLVLCTGVHKRRQRYSSIALRVT